MTYFIAHADSGILPIQKTNTPLIWQSVCDWLKKLESHPEISELLEEYVHQPGMKTTSIQNAHALDKFIDALRNEAKRPISPMTQPRPYIELE